MKMSKGAGNVIESLTERMALLANNKHKKLPHNLLFTQL